MDLNKGLEPAPELLETIGNLTRFRREHEKFYSQAPLRTAAEVQASSRVLTALAAQWSEASPADHPAASPFAGAEDLNPPGLTAERGVLFMEGEGEPAEIKQLKRDLETIAARMDEGGTWLARAMEQAWQSGRVARRLPVIGRPPGRTAPDHRQ